MSEQEKTAAQKIADAYNNLPEGKKEFLLGFAEGVAAARAQGKDEERSA